VQQILKYDVTM